MAAALLTSLDQGNMEIPVTSVTIEGQQLDIEARAISGIYRGTLGASGDIAGEWQEGSERLPLILKRTHQGR